MLKTLICLLFVPLFFISCKKEYSIENANLPQANTGKLLIKIVTKSGSDSSITNYQYDNNQRLVRESITGTSNGVDVSGDYQIIRNSSGLITMTIQKSPALLQAGMDSLVRIIHSDQSGRYNSAVSPISYNGITALDSTIFVYNPSGQVTEENTYAGYQGLTVQVAIVSFNYSTDGKNIIAQNMFADTSITSLNMVPVSATNYTFDNNVSPLILPGSEAFAIQREQLFNSNNTLQIQQNNTISPANSFTSTQTYTYNSFNEPVTSFLSYGTAGQSFSATYYYQ